MILWKSVRVFRQDCYGLGEELGASKNTLGNDLGGSEAEGQADAGTNHGIEILRGKEGDPGCAIRTHQQTKERNTEKDGRRERFGLAWFDNQHHLSDLRVHGVVNRYASLWSGAVRA